MDIEKDSSSNDCSSSSHNLYKQNTVNCFIQNLIKNYSLYEVINSIIYITSFDRNYLEENINNLSELNQIIYKIYKNLGSSYLFQSLLEVKNNDIVNSEIEDKNDDNKIDKNFIELKSDEENNY